MLDAARPVATIATVAAHCGVSRTTVSNAFNRPEQLSAALRRRVLATAAALGYGGPHPLARSLRMALPSTIGVLAAAPLSDALLEPPMVEFLAGVAAVGESANVSVQLLSAARRARRWRCSPVAGAASGVAHAAVAGMLAYRMSAVDSEFLVACERRIPLVAVDTPRMPGIAWVGSDEQAATASLAALLTSLGHRQVGIVCAAGDSAITQQRLAGFRSRWGEVPTIECDGRHPAAVQAAAAALLDAYPDATAIASTSDDLAIGVLDVVRSRGLAERVSVAGVDDIPLAERAGLTTVRHPHWEKGCVAWEILCAGADPSVRRTLPTQVVRRGSTQPVVD